MSTPVLMHKAVDGKVFDSKEEANQHEIWLDWLSLCRQSGLRFDDDAAILWARRGTALRLLAQALPGTIVVNGTAQDRIDVILYCPDCHLQHIDAQEPKSGWTNPPHRTHLCHGCGHKWRPADVPTNGVAVIEVKDLRGGEGG